MKKENLFLTVSADKFEFILDFSSNIYTLCSKLGITRDGFYRGVRRDSVNQTENCKYEILDLSNKVHKGHYKIVLFESEAEKTERINQNNPIITNLEEYRKINNQKVISNSRLIKNIYEFDNSEDFFNCRFDLLALGNKNNIQCFCKI